MNQTENKDNWTQKQWDNHFKELAKQEFFEIEDLRLLRLSEKDQEAKEIRSSLK